MKTGLLNSICVSSVGLFCLISCVNGRAASQEKTPQVLPSVSTSYSIAQRRLALFEPVYVNFEIVNASHGLVRVDLGQDRKGGFALRITPPGGVSQQLPPYSRDGMSRIGELTLQPGEKYSEQLLINEWYQFAAPGRHVLEIRLVEPIVAQDGTEILKDRGFREVLDVGPRDKRALVATCEALVNQIDASNSYEGAAKAAFALSYIKDPVAVPYLEKALSARKLIEPIVISGLERIADDSAVSALIAALKSSDNNISMLARGALQRIRAQASDSALQQEIENALKSDSKGNS
jgi:PBS lyase HEAT-like repeat-containing protein